MDDPSPAEITAEIHEAVKQFFHRHCNEFSVYGDALEWLQAADYEEIRQEAGALGRSLFTTDVLFLISSYGPNTEIDFDPLMPKVKKAKPDYIPPEPEPEPEVKKKPKRRGRPPGRKKGGPTNTWVEKEPSEKVADPVAEPNSEPTWTPTKRVKRRAGRVPPGALAEAE